MAGWQAAEAEVVHSSEGWTNLLPAPTALHPGKGACPSVRSKACCQRHPRASGCSARPPLMIRDDLFLRQPAQRAAHPAPTVVRGYLACDPARSDPARLVQEANRTAALRAALRASPLPIVAIVYFGTHHERLGLLRAYEQYFRRVVYMSPSKEVRAALRGTGPARGAARAASFHCRHPNKARRRPPCRPRRRAACSGAGREPRQRVLAAAARARTQVSYACVAEVTAVYGHDARGTLFFHFDLWVQPWALWPTDSRSDATRAALLESVWAAPQGRIMQKQAGPTKLLPLECFNATRTSEYRDLYPAWTWDRDLPPVLAATADAARMSNTGVRSARVCIGWADLYYVPSRHFDQFSRLAAVYSKRAANAELAIPTILNALAEAPLEPNVIQQAGRAGEERSAIRNFIRNSHSPHILRPKCWGYCCSSTICPELMFRHPCGHRMQLSESRMRTAFKVLWGV
ncbi:hypothetical protein AB1Y20_006012 [Prymnesium parvum]|uniref:Uncharacterized protein n=1 Tax=Prymnesium parvum TaxID=97485 RepID=A0AB34J1D0_PRYPA